MKPGDHPEFFRFPPPDGTSRESTLFLDRHGQFFHNGERVIHPALEKALRTWVRAHPDNGRPILENGYDWCYFTAEDTPLFVDAVVQKEDGSFALRVFDGSEEPLVPSALSVDEDGVVCARVRHQTVDARFLRHAQTGLSPILVSADPPTLLVEGQKTVLPLRKRQPAKESTDSG